MRRIVILVVAALVMLTVVAPGVLAAPQKPPNENFGGSENSTEHRSNASGKGNFGQCHRLQAGSLPEESSELNPSAQNTGEADCRRTSGLSAVSIANCTPPTEPLAESQLTFRPVQRADASGACAL